MKGAMRPLEEMMMQLQKMSFKVLLAQDRVNWLGAQKLLILPIQAVLPSANAFQCLVWIKVVMNLHLYFQTIGHWLCDGGSIKVCPLQLHDKSWLLDCVGKTKAWCEYMGVLLRMKLQVFQVIGLSEASVPITGSFTISDPPGGGLSVSPLFWTIPSWCFGTISHGKGSLISTMPRGCTGKR